jgi:hypothetical protein
MFVGYADAIARLEALLQFSDVFFGCQFCNMHCTDELVLSTLPNSKL